ncbi:MAG: hypothetical protein EXX96DRAFT_619643 [Benjaminiella poitrasii]|nr:MAG: hypothetical protein EXX96DRAFT_619643 [Benjaminiella poitrasii]
MSYISSLNLLNTDSPVTTNEETFQEELALWANAQFSFDTTPGIALKEDDNEKEKQLLQTLTKLSQLVQQQESNNSAVFPQQQQSLIDGATLAYFPITTPSPSSSTSSIKTTASLPRIAPAPGPFSSVQLMEANQASYNSRKSKRSASEDDVELSAEEDKRRRNTAASARFRMKKKIREQALERTAKETAEHVEKLEAKVKELEMEAKWLRNLVLEKDPNLLKDKSFENEKEKDQKKED